MQNSIKKNLGMTLEKLINKTNEYYLFYDIAIIHKKPTPIQIVKVSYPKRSMAKITQAFFKNPSTTDYNGIYKGKYIDFDCKETSSKTSFPLSNIGKHQIKHLTDCYNHGGIAFLIVNFKLYGEYYILPIEVINQFINDNTRKSISYSYFKEKLFLVKLIHEDILNYINFIDLYIKEER